MKPTRAISRSIWIGSILLTSLVVGCATTNQLAPVVNSARLRGAGLDEQSLAMLQDGRQIYITKCARCHSPESVTSYTREQWSAILPRMAKKAGLSVGDRKAVTEYVMTVLIMHERTPAIE